MNETLEELKQKRDENFKKLGQWQLQKKYYEDRIKNLLEHQEYLCNKIIGMMRDNEQ
jgi:hypothetical protein